MNDAGSAAPMRPWLTVATYNIHDAIGADGKFAPARIAAVIGELNADVIALQEIGSHVAGTDVLAFLRDATSYIAVAGPTRLRSSGEYGNCLLTRFPVQETTRIDLTFRAAGGARRARCPARLRRRSAARHRDVPTSVEATSGSAGLRWCTPLGAGVMGGAGQGGQDRGRARRYRRLNDGRATRGRAQRGRAQRSRPDRGRAQRR